ncbi:MAG: serine/threonine-protein kinase [Planctomycetota bacterium]|nr:serine/threonine-protein kinase [Planctomycetota bacterium]
MQPHPRYQPVEKIASGSFATVYRGRDVELGRDVAIKQIHEQYLSDPQQLERYWAEAQLLASFQHPNIVTIYDLVRDRGWLIMELMQSDLSKVAGRRPMDLNALRTTLAHSLRALKFLHAHGIVHGDIKPSNMMIDRRRRVKLGDFGLARRVSDEAGSLIKGTTKYMAPEVVSDEFGEVGPASDLYSLGFAAYELLAGENFESLFPGLNTQGRDRQMAWMMWHAAPDRRLPEISRVLQDVPADLAKTIQKLVAKSQSDRYQTADQALSDLNIDVKVVKGAEESSATIQRPEPANPDKRRRMLLIGAFAFSAIMSMAMLFMPQGGGSNPDPQAMAAADRVGIVQSVQRENMAVVIVLPDGAVATVPLGKEPIVRREDGDKKYLAVADLKPDDRVAITFRTDKGEPRATVAVRRPVESTGLLKQIDPARKTVRISVDADPRPEDVDMTVGSTAELLLNGKPIEFEKFSPGDRVEVTHLSSSDPEAPRSIIRLSALHSQRQDGFVAEVVTENGATYLRLDRFGLIENLKFSDECQVTIDGESGDGKPFGPGDLKPDDRVEITYDVKVTAVDATRRPRGSGVMMKVDLGARELVLRGNDAKETSYVVGENCVLLLNGKPIALDDLKKLDRLEITFESRDGAPGKAVTIDGKRTP